jgi:uncharacterized membrane protein YuzA (DUF378 family)
MSISANPWVWIMGLSMVGIFSFIFKENATYRALEHIYVGLAAGYAVSVAFGNIYDRAWTPLVKNGQYVWLIPIVLGLMLYTRFFRSVSWVSRWPMAFIVGIGTGLSIFGVINTQLIGQTRAAMISLIVKDKAGAIILSRSINNAVMVAGVICVISYFFFSWKQTESLRKVSAVGRVYMMIAFGVAFGNVVMGRISLLLGAIETIFGNWLGMLPI